MVIVGHGNADSEGHGAKADTAEENGAKGIHKGKYRVCPQHLGIGGAHVLDCRAEASVKLCVVDEQNAHDGERRDEHDYALNGRDLRHGFHAAGGGVDDRDDNHQQQAQIVLIAAGDGGEHLCTCRDLRAGGKQQSHHTGNGQRRDDGLGAKTQTVQVKEGNSADPLLHNGSLQTHGTQTERGGQEAGVVNYTTRKAFCIGQTGCGDHGAAGHGVCGGNHGNGESAQSAAARKEGGQVIGRNLFGLELDIGAKADNDKGIDNEDNHHGRHGAGAHRKSAEIDHFSVTSSFGSLGSME